jgi:hypothetical protein
MPQKENCRSAFKPTRAGADSGFRRAEARPTTMQRKERGFPSRWIIPKTASIQPKTWVFADFVPKMEQSRALYPVLCFKTGFLAIKYGIKSAKTA